MTRLRKIVTVLILVPVAVVFIVFAVANREIVTVSLDPFGAPEPAYSVRMPLFVLIFAFLIAGVLLGGFAAWLRQGRHRRASRVLRSDLAGLRHEIETLNNRLETERETRDPGGNRVPLPPPGI
jgi:uncharacterized integral membrane protein